MRYDYTEWGLFTDHDLDEDPPVLEEIQIVREFVERYGTSDPIPANDAARKLMSLVNEDRLIEEREDGIVEKGNRISYLLWDVGIDIPRSQIPILKLVEAIRALPELERTEEQIRAGRFEDQLKAWKSLEKFEFVWNSISKFRWPGTWHGFYGLYPFDALDGYHGAQAFYARHLATYPRKCKKRSRELATAFRVIVYALEQDPWNYANPRRIRVPTDHIQMLNSDVLYMAPFLEVSGQVIFRFIGKYDLSVLGQLTLPGCNLWQGDSLFSMERWEFWKTRLRWISEQDELMERTRDTARKIVLIMQEIDQQGQIEGINPVGQVGTWTAEVAWV